MRLSLMKAAHLALFGTAYRKYGYLPGFGRCGIPQHSTRLSLSLRVRPTCPGLPWSVPWRDLHFHLTHTQWWFP
jgi:hypothetical protein